MRYDRSSRICAIYKATSRGGYSVVKRFADIRYQFSYGDLHQRLLEEYAPPSTVVNADHEIVHLSPKAGRFLLVSGGEPSQNLLKLIKPEFRLELRSGRTAKQPGGDPFIALCE